MVNVEYPRTFDEMRESIKLKYLMEKATFVDIDNGADASRSNHLGLLCKTMVDVARFGPAKAEYEGRMFVVDKGATMEETLQAWKEQAWKPFVEAKYKAEVMEQILKLSAEDVCLDNTPTSYKEAGMTEVLISKYPESAKNLTMLQILNALKKSSGQNMDPIGKALKENVTRYTKGEETFPPTLVNMVSLDENRDLLNLSLYFNVAPDPKYTRELDKRIKESELKMLKELTPEAMSYLSDSIIAGGLRIADKHKDEGDFGKKFTTEIKRRLSEGNIFDPR